MGSGSNRTFCWLLDTCFGYHSLAIDRIEGLSERGWRGTLLEPECYVETGGILRDPAIDVLDIAVSTTYVSDIEKVIRFAAAAVKARAGVYIASQPVVCLAAWIAGTMLRRPVIYFPFELVGEEAGDRSKYQKVKNAVWLMVERWLLRRMDAEIHLCREICETYVKERGAKRGSTHTVEPLLRFREAGRVSTEEIVDEIGVDVDRNDMVFYTGAIGRERCIVDIVEAMGAMRHRNVVLVLIGKEVERGYYRECVVPVVNRHALDGRVVYLRWVSPLVLPDYIRVCDVGIALYTPHPRNNYFATCSRMSFYIQESVPLVTSAYPYLRRLVEGNGIGVCTKSGEPQDIADAIDAVLDRPKEYWRRRIDRAKPRLNGEREHRLFGDIVEYTRSRQA